MSGPSRVSFRRRLLGSSFHTRRALTSLIAGWITLAAVVATGLFESSDLRILDLELRLRAYLEQDPVPVRVALFDAPDLMDDLTFRDRSLELLTRLADPALPAVQRPALVAFTSPFLHRRDDAAFAPAFVEASRRAAPVVHSYLITDAPTGVVDDAAIRSSGFALPPGAETLHRAVAIRVPTGPLGALTSDATAIGFTNLAPEVMVNGVVRSLPLVVRFRDRAYPSVSLAAVMTLRGIRPDQVVIRPGQSVELRPSSGPIFRIPIDEHGETPVNFSPALGSARGPFPTLFAPRAERVQVVSSEPPGAMLSTLRPGGRLLLVGDPRLRVRTPLGSDVPLVQVQGQLVSDILSGSYLATLPLWIDVLQALLSVLGLAWFLGRWDPQGLGGVWAGVIIGSIHGALVLLVFFVGHYSMALALVGDTVFITVLVDGVYLHGYLKSALTRVRKELDDWERDETGYLDLLVREESEQTERLEQLRHEEILARSILDRQEALVARAIPARAIGDDGTILGEVVMGPAGRASGVRTTVRMSGVRARAARANVGPAGANGAPDAALGAAGEPLHAGSESRLAASPEHGGVGQQPKVIRELSGRYRAQVSRHEALLARYRQLLDQVLAELEDRRSRQPVAVVPGRGDADELVASTGVLTADPGMLRLLAQIVRRVGPNDRTTVLIHGESGTGKELIAKAIHRHSPRREGPFVALNCGAFPEGLIESELFGHVRGAFSGAARDRRGAFLSAQGGVLFLDEIGDAPPFIQVKLLRALQERQIRPVGADADLAVDVRIVAATHRDLRAAVRSGLFREDLYHRLHVIPIEIPPLRSRQGDVPLLSQLFLAREAQAGGHLPRALSEGALERLCAYDWPGNVRELENCIVALNAMVSDPVIGDRLISQLLGAPEEHVASHTQIDGFGAADLRWLEVFRRHRFSIVHAVAEPDAPARNRQTGYRRLVGLSCKALYLTNWSAEPAADLLAGEAGLAARGKALAKIHTYLRTIQQALEGKDPDKFEADWRRFLGDDFFFVKATLEAVRAGKVQAGEGEDEE